MKPRFIHLTTEDLAILALCSACNEASSNDHCICAPYCRSDRRDADLMFECQVTWRAGHRRSRPDNPYKGQLSVYRADSPSDALIDCGGKLRQLS
jgi:hypothetical protein